MIVIVNMNKDMGMIVNMNKVKVKDMGIVQNA